MLGEEKRREEMETGKRKKGNRKEGDSNGEKGSDIEEEKKAQEMDL